VNAKILVVEDNTDSRNLLHFCFTAKHLQVITASNGIEGIYLAETQKPALIVTDCDMPDGDGCELIRQVRETPGIAGTEIIVYTAFGLKMANQAMEAGANQVFYKPKDFVNLLQYVLKFYGLSDQEIFG
jgi:CheY-like chemotaxis protein